MKLSLDFPFSNRQSVPVTEILKEILTQGVTQKLLKTVIAKLWNLAVLDLLPWLNLIKWVLIIYMVMSIRGRYFVFFKKIVRKKIFTFHRMEISCFCIIQILREINFEDS